MQSRRHSATDGNVVLETGGRDVSNASRVPGGDV